ncbi:hypothetical protein HYC85_012592 [Camellia sinensis]|uniref:Uncharacterized protein n=1 Tax=Camellia sinensis TaxID=4442 RepID=A0A7J7HCZ3_CAMSI|nr:hypothetical protein HYC85_012592 [Camellia sinensis]
MKDIWLSSPDHVHEGVSQEVVPHDNLLCHHEDDLLELSGFGSSPYSSNSKTIDPAKRWRPNLIFLSETKN